MRRLSFVVALTAMLGWSGAAQAGSVTQYWDIDDQWGSSGATFVHLFNFSGFLKFTATDVKGHLKATINDPNSTFTSSVPPASATVHVASQCNTAYGFNTGGNTGDSDYWKITGTVRAKAKGSTSCHVGSNGWIKSCDATFYVATYAHCGGSGCTTNAPGTWPNGASSNHTNKWTAASVHLGDAQVTHTQASDHYLKSFQVQLTPTDDHLASSNAGYHTFHMGAKQATQAGTCPPFSSGG